MLDMHFAKQPPLPHSVSRYRRRTTEANREYQPVGDRWAADSYCLSGEPTNIQFIQSTSQDPDQGESIDDKDDVHELQIDIRKDASDTFKAANRPQSANVYYKTRFEGQHLKNRNRLLSASRANQLYHDDNHKNVRFAAQTKGALVRSGDNTVQMQQQSHPVLMGANRRPFSAENNNQHGDTQNDFAQGKPRHPKRPLIVSRTRQQSGKTNSSLGWTNSNIKVEGPFNQLVTQISTKTLPLSELISH